MQKKEMGEAVKKYSFQAVLTISLVTLVVGFIGGIVFSAFKMDSTVSGMSTMVATQKADTAMELTAEEGTRIEALEKAAKASPDNSEGWIALGNACFDSQLYPQAIHAYEHALEIFPGNADVCTDLGTVYRRSGDSQKAVEMYEKAQQITPGHEMSLLNAGIVYYHDLDDPAGAIDAWEKLLQVNPTATTGGGMLIKNMVETLKSQM